MSLEIFSILSKIYNAFVTKIDWRGNYEREKRKLQWFHRICSCRCRKCSRSRKHLEVSIFMCKRRRRYFFNYLSGISTDIWIRPSYHGYRYWTKNKAKRLKSIRNITSKMAFLGYLTFLVPALIMTYYSVIGGWITKYFCAYIISDGKAVAGDSYFTSFITSKVSPIVFMLFSLH